MPDHHADTLIAGGGIIGLTIARELLQQGYEDILVIDKEAELARHASGRNSGVLHAGIYYLPGSLKARSCLNGNRLMRLYCKERGLPLLETGKVIVARTEPEVPVLEELRRRAIVNGARVDLIDEHELKNIEPYARTCRRALFSHDTAVVDPRRVMWSLQQDLLASGKVRFLFNCPFLGSRKRSVAVTGCGEITYHRFINAAGAHCDRVARAFGVGANLRLIPFKGVYRKLRSEKSHLVKGNIYPVPDLRTPFLGVHFTRNTYGEVYLGPTAIPAFGRENYGALQGIDPETAAILWRDLVLFFVNPEFREVALREPRKYLQRFFFQEASKLVTGLAAADIEPSDKSGIRAQLVDWETRELVMDFLVSKQENSIHVLNPISPAFTSSMDLAQRVVGQYVD